MTAMLTAILAVALQQPAKAEEAGALTATNLTPGALVLLLRVPEESKDAALYARLWSENEESQLQALAALSEKDAASASARLAELSKSGTLRIQGEAFAKLGKGPSGSDPVGARTIADIDGIARFPKAPAGRWHLFATRPLSADLHRPGVEIAAGRATTLDAKEEGVRAEGLRIRVSSGGKVLGEAPLRAGEALEVPVPGPTVRIEVTDGPAGGGDRLGRIQLASRVYGIFVKLDPGFAATPGEEVVILRDGREVARAKIVKVMSGDPKYPDGVAQTATDPGAVQKGDEVRRVKEENK